MDFDWWTLGFCVLIWAVMLLCFWAIKCNIDHCDGIRRSFLLDNTTVEHQQEGFEIVAVAPADLISEESIDNV